MNHEGIKRMGFNFETIELPCIEHADSKDKGELVNLFKSGEIQSFDYVVVTSPESARVLASAMNESGVAFDTFHQSVNVAAVGKATNEALLKVGIRTEFVPSQANGATLSAELPSINTNENGVTRVLYPASAKARNDIQDGLMARKNKDGKQLFEFKRLNTYDTVPATFTKEQLTQIDDIQIACFGSPSAVEAWLKNVEFNNLDQEKKNLGSNGNVVAACIGSTSAKAVLDSGRWSSKDLYYPKENPGVESWVASIALAMGDVMKRKPCA